MLLFASCETREGPQTEKGDFSECIAHQVTHSTRLRLTLSNTRKAKWQIRDTDAMTVRWVCFSFEL